MGSAPSTGYLNGLRALSAFWVLTAHCLIWGGYEGFTPNAKLAVAVFMVLSGYLMAHTAKDFSTAGGWGRFYLKRFFRIAPLYYLVLAAVALSPWVQDGFAAWHRFPPGTAYDPRLTHFDLTNIALHVSFVFGLIPGANTSTLLPDWSLSLEMQFYAVFPAIWLAVRRWGGLRVCAVLGMVSLAAWTPLRAAWHDPSPLPLQLPYFLAGILAFEAKREPPLAVLALILAAFEAPYSGLEALVVPVVVGVIYALDRWPVTPLRRLLDNPAMTVGADISYGVYLTHGLFIAAGGLMGFSIPRLLLFTTIGSCAVSYLLHLAVERPGIRLGAKLSATAL